MTFLRCFPLPWRRLLFFALEEMVLAIVERHVLLLGLHGGAFCDPRFLNAL